MAETGARADTLPEEISPAIMRKHCGIAGEIAVNNLGIALLVASASAALVFFTYVSCKTITQMEEVLPRWAEQHGFRIIRKEARTFFQGPFSVNRYRPVYYVTIEDEQHRQKTGWVRLGWWYILGFKEHIEVCWED